MKNNSCFVLRILFVRSCVRKHNIDNKNRSVCFNCCRLASIQPVQLSTVPHVNLVILVLVYTLCCFKHVCVSILLRETRQKVTVNC